MATFDDLERDAVSNLDGRGDLFGGEGLIFIHGKVFLLNLFAKLVLDLQILLVSCQRISILNKIFRLLLGLLLLNKQGGTREIGSRYF
jgi:hypothetical protein